jgi:hypothetical protein
VLSIRPISPAAVVCKCDQTPVVKTEPPRFQLRHSNVQKGQGPGQGQAEAARKGHQLLEVNAGEQQIEIPDDAQKVSIFVVDHAGDCVSQVHLASVYEC